LQELLNLMTEIMQSEKKDKEKDKKSKDTFAHRKTSMFPGELLNSGRRSDGSEVPLGTHTPPIDTPPQTPKTSTAPDIPLCISPLKVRAHAQVCWFVVQH
jgi:hypothetical protein